MSRPRQGGEGDISVDACTSVESAGNVPLGDFGGCVASAGADRGNPEVVLCVVGMTTGLDKVRFSLMRDADLYELLIVGAFGAEVSACAALSIANVELHDCASFIGESPIGDPPHSSMLRQDGKGKSNPAKQSETASQLWTRLWSE